MSNSSRVSDKMLSLDKFPVLSEKDSLKKALDEMTRHRLGTACFINENGRLMGVLTDGDLRRLLLTRQSPLPALLVTSAIEFGNHAPTSIKIQENVEVASKLMHDRQIWDLPIVDDEMKLVGLVHRHDLN